MGGADFTGWAPGETARHDGVTSVFKATAR